MKFIQFYKLCFFCLLFLLNFNHSFSQKKYTAFEIGVGIAPNFNFHNPSFAQFEGYPNCCSEFSSGFGIAYSIKSFLSYHPTSSIFEKKWGLNFNLQFDNLSGILKSEDFFANIIVGNELKKGISEHKLEANLDNISFEPEIFIKPLNNLKFNLSLGFRLGIISKSDFKYSETLISPEGATFENYSRIRNNSEGRIPDISPLSFAVSFGANYTFLEFSNFKVFSSIKYYQGISDIVKNLNWKINNLQAGLNISYKIPKAEAIPPKPAPQPVYPEPPTAIEFDARLIAIANERELFEGDTIDFKIYKEITKRTFPLQPIIFFSKNSALIPEIIIQPTGFTSKYSLNKELLNQVVMFLKSSNNSKITIIASSSSDEPYNLAKERLNSVSNYLEQSGISRDRIVSEEKIIETQKNSTIANDDENYYVQLRINQNKDLHLSEIEEKVASFEKIDFELKTKTNNPDFLKEITAKICVNDIIIENFYSDSHKFSLSENHYQNLNLTHIQKLFINAVYIDKTGLTNVSNLNYYIRPIETVSKTNENIFVDLATKSEYKEFILGYFNFNESDFSFIDKRVKEIALEYYNAGKRIEILPFTDNIGSPEYNKSLASRRAETAVKELNLDKNKISIKITGDFPFSNNTPNERIYNRSVFIRIFD